MSSYETSSLWQQALAPKVSDPSNAERERLRVAYEELRLRVKPLGETIAKDFPWLTVHDITHSEALWQCADRIAGPDYPLNPCEAFVLGGAFLIHDLGMGLVAYREGLAGLRSRPLYQDTVVGLQRQFAGGEKSRNDAESAKDIPMQALFEVVRSLHAEQAETLVSNYWTSPTGDQRFYLIDIPELRQSFGPMIGRVAYSHW
jgi:hypothetical protein